jgi:hypothetical protein
MNHPTVAVIVRVYGPNGVGVPDAPVLAQLSDNVVYHGFTIPAQQISDTDGYGMCVLRLWPNVLGATPTRYKFTITNPDSGKRMIVYAVIPNDDVFLDEIATSNEGDWTDGTIGDPPANGGGTGTAATIMAGTTTTGAPGTAAQAINRGTPQARIVDFVIPAGRDGLPGQNGLNGTGTITVKQTITGAPGTPASVVNTGTGDRAELVFTIPAGQPGGGTGSGDGSGLPAGGTDGQVLVKTGATAGAATWKDLTLVAEALQGLYAWEVGVTQPPAISPTTLDATTRAAYLTAIAEAPIGSKRTAAANALIVAMGSAQKLTLKRNGIAVLTADYTGAMVQTNDGTNIGVTLGTLSAVSPILAAEVTTGTWTGEIAGGTSFTRLISLQIAPDVSTAPGQGFNPNVNLIVPRSVDGL